MQTLIFRNNTIEPLFKGSTYLFSDYDDISLIDDTAYSYIWFYQVPFKFDHCLLLEEISSYKDKLDLLVKKIPNDKQFIIFSLVDLYNFKIVDSHYEIALKIEDFNHYALSLSKSNHNIKYIDFLEFTREFEASELIDWKFYFLSQMSVNPRLSKKFSLWFENKKREIELKRKKCIVLDLDNTLWGGILGEDGIDGIKIGGDYPGKAFQYFQEALKALSKSGIVLTACSKNNETDVLEAWERNPFLILKKDDFASWRINWNDKASNIREIAEELNIGLDSMVFVDDNPSERELIKSLLPMVEVPELPKHPYNLPVFIKSITEKYFQVYSVTTEDLGKTEQYKLNALRANAARSFDNIDDFIKSLDIRLLIEPVNEFTLARVAQMTQKTNQFNLTTHRYTEEDLKHKLSSGAQIWTLSVKDKFGDNGITGCIIIENDEIDTFLLSCRILGKKIEDAFFNVVMERYFKTGKKILKGKYIPTLKNSQVSNLYDRLGAKLNKDDDGTKEYLITKDCHNLNKKLHTIE